MAPTHDPELARMWARRGLACLDIAHMKFVLRAVLHWAVESSYMFKWMDMLFTLVTDTLKEAPGDDSIAAFIIWAMHAVAEDMQAVGMRVLCNHVEFDAGKFATDTYLYVCVCVGLWTVSGLI